MKTLSNLLDNIDCVNILSQGVASVAVDKNNLDENDLHDKQPSNICNKIKILKLERELEDLIQIWAEQRDRILIFFS